MIDFPKEITDKTLPNFLRAGAVIKTEVVFPDGGQKIKRLVVLTNNNDEIILAATATSNILSSSRYYGYDDIFVDINKEKMFDKDTFIQLNRVIEIPLEKLKCQYHRKELEILGNVSDELLLKMYAKIDKSKMIERKYINRIINEKLPTP
ncbi:hypothetical protein NO2_1199 [Candidatus Termititenax persephonae]|uniref:Uncharacterized protein n=1 Tax=Candidatus Termititenax persephonae TaxID=2218525 RepID=A0A388THQ3_9BACT|nr:hypothetical protein NO2_1199 [Candidatus Termititenax persephonae]